MRTIIIITEEEADAVKAPSFRPKSWSDATMILTDSGRVIKSATGFCDFTVDMEKLTSVLNGDKRVKRKSAS